MNNSNTKYTNHPREYVKALNEAHNIKDPKERATAYDKAELLICSKEDWLDDA